MEKKNDKNLVEVEKFFKQHINEYKYFLRLREELVTLPYDKQVERVTNLREKYINAVITLREQDEYESGPLMDVYKDCLTQLGIDPYSLDSVIESYSGSSEVGKAKVRTKGNK